MRTKSFILIAVFGGVIFAQPSASADIFQPDSSGASAAANSQEDHLYDDGTRAINEERWSDAESIFDRVIEQHGQRADAALYWKAYAQNKAGQSSQALATCRQLRQTFAHSRWLEECGALEIEIRGKSGQPVSPQTEQDEDLKLLALNALMQQDDARALPAIQQILNGNHSEKLKEHALFVLAQSQSKQAQDLLGQIAAGQTNPTLQVHAIRMLAAIRGKQSDDVLANVYQHSNDERVKKAVLQAYMITGDSAKLADAAQHESNPELARTAVHELGAQGATSELLRIYRSTNSGETKSAIVDSLVASGKKGADALASIAASEQDANLRRKAIRNLGIAGGTSAAPGLIATYQNNSDRETKKAVVDALFIAGDAHDLVALAKAEKDPAAREDIVQKLSLMHSSEATEYMIEILNK